MVFAAAWTTTSVAIGVLAVVALVSYFVLLAILAVRTRPRRPAPGPKVMEIRDDESPAVAGFLANAWKVPRAAVPATLIDLAARGIVAIEEVGPDDFHVRILQRSPVALTPYERRVYDHVRGLVDPDGVVPCRALTIGPQAESSAWWNKFRTDVVADARTRGLSRSRWRGRELVVLAFAGAVPAVLGFVAITLAVDDAHGGSGTSGWGYVPLAVWFGLLAIPASLRAERDTPLGSEVAARWLGLQAFLRDDAAFGDYPVAAVAIWQRYLSYGAALGVAPAAVAALPMGVESAHEAWSKQSGQWRLLQITYRQWPPGWGRSPGKVVVSAALTLSAATACGAGTFVLLTRLAASGAATDHASGQVRNIGVWIVAVVFAVALVGVVASVGWLSYAIPDLNDRKRLRGRVLRIRDQAGENGTETWIAVDDGTCLHELRAWHLASVAPPEIVEGCLVDVTVTPRLGHVAELSRVAEADSSLPSQRMPATVGPLSQRLFAAIGAADHDEAPTPPPPTSALDLQAVERATGVRLSLRSHRTIGADGGPEFWELVDGGTGRVILARGAQSAWSNNAGCLAGPLTLARLNRQRGQPVAGVGERATWSARQSTLVAHGDSCYMTTAVLLDGVPLSTRRDVAVALTRQLV